LGKGKKRKNLRHRFYRGPLGAIPPIAPGELVLESISEQEYYLWRDRGKEYQEYHYLWYFELEAQRASHQSELLDALRSVPGATVNLTGWGRAIALQYSHAPLSCLGSLKWVGGRFNYGIDIDQDRFAPFPALYIAEDVETGLREMQGLTSEDSRSGLTPAELNLCGKSSFAWAVVTGSVANVFDITSPSNLENVMSVFAQFKLSSAVRATERRMQLPPKRIIGTAPELLESFMIEGWRQDPNLWSTPSNSQIFGHLVSQAGFEGILYTSVRTRHRNLALFPRQFKNSSSIVSVVGASPSASCCELSAKTYEDLERVIPQLP
jgi:hypothetical protein